MRKIKRNSNPVLFQNSDFQTIQIKVYFPFKREEKDIAKVSLLPNMLHYMNMEYPTEREFNLEKQRLYILSCYCSYDVIVDESYFVFKFMIPDTYSLNKDLLEEQFKFISNVIYNPKIDNNHFDHDEFIREVKNIKVDIEKTLNDPGTYAVYKAKEIVDTDHYYSDSILNHQEQLDLVTEDNLYDFYLDKIYNNKPFIYVFGNVDNNRINDLCNKYLYRQKVEEKVFEIETKHYLPIDKYKYVHEKSDFRNSVFISVYKIKDMCEDDEVLLGVVQRLLSSQSTRYLSKVLRDQLDLVYSVSANSTARYAVLAITAFIHKNTVDLVKEKIHEVLNSLKDEEFISEGIENIKERNRVSLIRQLDNKVYLFSDKIIEETGISYTSHEHYDKLIKVSAKDISNFIDRLVLDTEYFLEEGEHE